MNKVKRIEKKLLIIEENFVVYSLLSLIILQILQVFFRYVLSSPLAWVNEFSILLFVWMTMVGSAVGVQWVEHFAVPFVEEKFPPLFQKINGIFTNLLSIIFMLILIVFGTIFILSTMGQVTPNLGLPVELLYFAVPVGSLLMILHLILRIILNLNKGKDGN